MNTIGAVSDVPSRRAETAAYARRTAASIASWACNVLRSFAERNVAEWRGGHGAQCGHRPLLAASRCGRTFGAAQRARLRGRCGRLRKATALRPVPLGVGSPHACGQLRDRDGSSQGRQRRRARRRRRERRGGPVGRTSSAVPIRGASVARRSDSGRGRGGREPDACDRRSGARRASPRLVPHVPMPVWGRDELDAGEMWNSNSLTSWLICRSGLHVETIRLPPGGRAPGWHAGVVVARRQALGSGSS